MTQREEEMEKKIRIEGRGNDSSRFSVESRHLKYLYVKLDFNK